MTASFAFNGGFFALFLALQQILTQTVSANDGDGIFYRRSQRICGPTALCKAVRINHYKQKIRSFKQNNKEN